MNPRSLPSPPLAGLLSKLVDGVLSPEDHAKLEDILRQSAEARQYYRDYLAIHLELAESIPEVAQGKVVAMPHSSSGRWRAIAVSVAAAIAIAVGVALLLPRDPGHHDGKSVVEAPAPTGLAEVTVAKDVQWDHPESAFVGQRLPAGRIQLGAGTLALAFDGGQIITIAGPSTFEVVSPTELSLQEGNASLRMEREGERCAIRVPRGKIVDIGTEFSVRVDAEGTADVWVFEGMAMVTLDPDSPQPERKTLSVGQSVRMSRVLAPSPAKETDFIRSTVAAVESRPPRERIIADFASEFPGSTRGHQNAFGGTERPMPGWRYLWNPGGSIGRASEYQPLVPNTVDAFPEENGGGRSAMFTHRPDLPFNHGGQGNFVFGRVAMTAVHPGKKDCRAILAYTIQPGEEGNIRIVGSSLSKYRIDGIGGNGVDLDVFVNDTLVAGLSKDGFQSLISTNFDGELGRLSAGDTVYVTVGNNGEDSHAGAHYDDAFDACRIDFRLQSTP